MSNLLKSKYILGFMIVAFMLVGVAFTASSAKAECSLGSTTLKYGQKSAAVTCLQTYLNISPATGYFGKLTLAAVKAYQANHALTADGIVGAKSKAIIVTGAPVVTTGDLCPNGMTLASNCMLPPGGTTAQLCPNGMTLASNCTLVPGGTVQGTGPVSVALATNNPATATLIASQATADLAHFTFSGSGTVNSITLQRTGVSNNTVFDSVYLYNGSTRLTESASVNNSGLITFNNVGLVVNGPTTVSVMVDINSGASSQTAGVTLTGYTTAGSTTATTVSVAGNIMNIVSGSGIVGTITLGTNTATGSAVNAGTTQYTFWSAPVTVGTHSMLLKSFSLKFVGSAPNDALANIKLYVDGTPVGTSTGPNALGYMVFDFGATPFSLSANSHTFDVRADVVKGSSRTVQLSLQNRADFMATDSQANVNVGIGSFSTNSGNTVTISTGTVSVTIDPTFQSMTNVTGGATNAVIGKYKLHAYGEDVKVSTLYVKPTLASQSGVAAAGLNNVSLFFNGSQIGSSQNMATADTVGGLGQTKYMTYNLGSSLIIPAGVDSFLEVHADLTTYSTNLSYINGTVAVSLTGNGAGAGATLDNGQGMNSMVSTIDVPGSDQTTSGLTIQTGLIAIAQNVSMGATSINPNTQNAKIGSFVIQNQSTSEGVHITNLNIGLALTTADSNNYSNFKTSETTGSGANPINPTYAAAETTSWNNFPVDFVLAAGATKTLDIFADVGTATGSLITKLYLTAVGSNSNSSICSPTKAGGTVDGCNHYVTSPETNPAVGQTATIQAATFNNGGSVIGSSTQPQYIATGSTGATDATTAVFNFRSTNGATTISEMKIAVSSSAGTTVSTVRVGTVSAPVVSSVAYLTGLNLVVPVGSGGLNVPVYMTYAPVGSNMAGTSGSESYAELTYVKYQVGTTTGYLTGGQGTIASNTTVGNITAGTMAAAAAAAADITFTSVAQLQPGMTIAIHNISGSADGIGQIQSVNTSTNHAMVITLLQTGTPALGSGSTAYFYSIPQNAAYASTVNNCSQTLSEAGVTVAAGGTSGTDCMAVVGSKPSLTVVDASTQLINGLVKVGSVTVSADTKGDIAINALPLTFNSTGNVTIANTANNLVVKNAADNSTINTTNSGFAVGAGGSGSETVTFTGGYTVTAGQSVTLDIYATAATVTGGPAANVLSMKLGTAGSLTWTDVAGSGSTAGETGTLIYNYPTNSSTIND